MKRPAGMGPPAFAALFGLLQIILLAAVSLTVVRHDLARGQAGQKFESAHLQVEGATSAGLAALNRQIAAQDARERDAQRTLYGALIISQLICLCGGLPLVWLLRWLKEAERAASQNASLLRATLENVDHGVAMIDREGHLLAWNEQLITMFGAQGLKKGDPALGPEEIQGARTHEPLNLERVLGESLCLEVRGRPAPDDTYVVTYTDISERRRSERLKSDFVSTVSHELRTPLTAIRGALGLLTGPLSGGLSERARGMMLLADRNAKRLAELINDLLDVDKIESGRMTFHLSPVDLNSLAREAAETNHSFAIDREVTMAVGCTAGPVLVHADGSRILQVMANLVSNAAKFSPPRSMVTITVERSGRAGRVSVHDVGQGIPADFQPRIFDKFAQAASGDARATRGSGLGLNISKAIVEGHGGTIGFETRPGSTTFTFSLPLTQA